MRKRANRINSDHLFTRVIEEALSCETVFTHLSAVFTTTDWLTSIPYHRVLCFLFGETLLVIAKNRLHRLLSFHILRSIESFISKFVDVELYRDFHFI